MDVLSNPVSTDITQVITVAGSMPYIYGNHLSCLRHPQSASDMFKADHDGRSNQWWYGSAHRRPLHGRVDCIRQGMFLVQSFGQRGSC